MCPALGTPPGAQGGFKRRALPVPLRAKNQVRRNLHDLWHGGKSTTGPVALSHRQSFHDVLRDVLGMTRAASTNSFMICGVHGTRSRGSGRALTINRFASSSLRNNIFQGRKMLNDFINFLNELCPYVCSNICQGRKSVSNQQPNRTSACHCWRHTNQVATQKVRTQGLAPHQTPSHV